MPTEPRVADNPRASRYELWLGTTRAGLIEYRSVPMTYRTPKPLARMLAREETSRDYPQVVDRVPLRRRPHPTPPNPAHARLPRP